MCVGIDLRAICWSLARRAGRLVVQDIYIFFFKEVKLPESYVAFLRGVLQFFPH